jgi:hypothetical protein
LETHVEVILPGSQIFSRDEVEELPTPELMLPRPFSLLLIHYCVHPLSGKVLSIVLIIPPLSHFSKPMGLAHFQLVLRFNLASFPTALLLKYFGRMKLRPDLKIEK